MLYRTNKSLKEIAKMVGLSIPLTLYVAVIHGRALLRVRISLFQLSAKVWDAIQK